MTNRREFIAWTAGFAVAGRGLGALVESPNLRLGVISDVHVRVRKEGDVSSGDVEELIAAFAHFRDCGVDAVLMCGDLADRGLKPDLLAVGAAWDSVFPGGRAPDGRRVEKLFIYGNHDWEGWSYGYKYGDRFAKDLKDLQIRAIGMDRCWEEAFHEDYRAIYRKDVRGYRFIGAHWDGFAGVASATFRKDLPAFLSGQLSDYDPKRPFFYFQHLHPKDTCYGPWAWGHDNGSSTDALSRYANAVAFSGHSHYSLTDERSLWRGAFTSVGCGSLRYTGIAYDEFPPSGFENSSAPAKFRGTEDPEKVMPVMRTDDCHQGLVVDVFDDRMVIRRLSFPDLGVLGADWTVPLYGVSGRSYSFAARAAQEKAPEFPSGARLDVRRMNGKNRHGAEVEAWELSFPAAVSGGSRPYRYEISVRGSDGKDIVRHVLAEGFNGVRSSTTACAKTSVRIPASSVPEGASFEVRPVSSLGNRGRAIRRKVDVT